MRTVVVPAICCALGACDGVFKLIEVDAPPDARAADAPVDVIPDTVPQDLIAWYKLDSLTNERAIEEIAARDGECSGASCPTQVSGPIDGVFEFDGVIDIIDVPPTIALDTTTQVTVMAWVRQTSTNGSYACAVTKQYGVNYFNSWELCTNGGAFWVYWYDGNYAELSGGALSLDEWHHVAARWDGNVLAIAVNGAVTATSATALYFDGGAVRIGGDRDVGTLNSAWPGQIDDVRIYNRALSDVELAALANR